MRSSLFAIGIASPMLYKIVHTRRSEATLFILLLMELH
ncbi:hypothetical protein CSC30_2920 [Pseudomonas aeruginosa]|nr:hypothetical protein CSC30_2920 [Pseudomonas aeruginosa]QJE88353.1 Uncharacterized protein PA52Ts17_0561 [Pseudomonas aeruginosa]